MQQIHFSYTGDQIANPTAIQFAVLRVDLWPYRPKTSYTWTPKLSCGKICTFNSFHSLLTFPEKYTKTDGSYRHTVAAPRGWSWLITTKWNYRESHQQKTCHCPRSGRPELAELWSRSRQDSKRAPSSWWSRSALQASNQTETRISSWSFLRHLVT